MKRLLLFFSIFLGMNHLSHCAWRAMALPALKTATAGCALYTAGSTIRDTVDYRKAFQKGNLEETLVDRSSLPDFLQSRDQSILFNDNIQSLFRKKLAQLLPLSEYKKIDPSASDILSQFYFTYHRERAMPFYGARYKNQNIIAISGEQIDASIKAYHGRDLTSAEFAEIYDNEELLVDILFQKNREPGV